MPLDLDDPFRGYTGAPGAERPGTGDGAAGTSDEVTEQTGGETGTSDVAAEQAGDEVTEQTSDGAGTRDGVTEQASDEVTEQTSDAAFLRLLTERRVSAVFQPVVELVTGEVVAYEALARGPEGTAFESPGELFARAAALGRTAELDWVCRAAAFGAFLEADVPPSASLFVNVEIASLLDECPEDLLTVVGHAEAQLRVLIEVDDGTLAADPAGLVATVERARAMGWGISIDDLGTSLGCLSVLPMIRADVVKVGIRAFGGGDGSLFSPVVAAVLQHVELAGAELVVKGIESDDDVRLARALGARYGQGHHLGTPGPLPAEVRAPRALVPLRQDWTPEPAVPSPFDLLSGHERRTVTLAELETIARLLYTHAVETDAHPVVLMGLGDGPENEERRAAGRARLADMVPLTSKAVLTVAFGVACPPDPGEHARGVAVPRSDPLAEQPFLVILTEHLAVALVARRSRATRGAFEMILTQEPQSVDDVARHLLRRVPPAGGPHTLLPLRRGEVPGPGVPTPRAPADDDVPAPVAGARVWHGWLGGRRR
ncbi:EAL domain-containing protein [Cellulomonas sp. APG4]|uniref:sensor domain-containing phosphodiesterase n=1 Tax=Cellulomonas sp. APG4 TaxID=1538656 RepID=UPI00137AE454|nr:EAL domain-containing protein [Cellulomonas sp. APG4]